MEAWSLNLACYPNSPRPRFWLGNPHPGAWEEANINGFYADVVNLRPDLGLPAHLDNDGTIDSTDPAMLLVLWSIGDCP